MRDKRLFLCLGVALVLRLGFIFVGFPALESRWHLREDGDGYGAIAQTIREGRYDDVVRGPVYPAIVALAGSPLAVKLLHAILDTVTCLLIYRLAGCRLLAAWLWAVYPFAIWRVAFINKEIVVTFLMAAHLCLLLAALRDQRPSSWLWAGVTLGVLNLTKPLFLVWPAVFVFFAPRRAWLAFAAMLAIVLPWTYRNWRMTGGELLPVATERGGMTTFVGNYQRTLGAWEGVGKLQWLAAVAIIRMQNADASAVGLDRAYYRAAWEQGRSNPLKAGELAVRKCWRFWFVSAAQRERVASFAIQLAYLALAGVGLYRLSPWDMATKLFLAVTGYVMLTHALSYADLRFSLPVMPFVCVFGASALGKTRD